MRRAPLIRHPHHFAVIVAVVVLACIIVAGNVAGAPQSGGGGIGAAGVNAAHYRRNEDGGGTDNRVTHNAGSLAPQLPVQPSTESSINDDARGGLATADSSAANRTSGAAEITTAAAATVAPKRSARVAPPWRHLAAAKHLAPWDLPPPPRQPLSPPKQPPQTPSTSGAAAAPRFGRVPPAIEVWPGQTAILSCIVYDLGDRMVSWIRTSDLQILTAGPLVFTSDERMSVDFEAAATAAEATARNRLESNEGRDADDEDEALGIGDGNNDGDEMETSWPLTIRQVQASDVGLYECQINTEPKQKANVTLLVHEPQLAEMPFAGVTIDGARESVIAAGQHISLVCRSPPAPAGYQAPVHQQSALHQQHHPAGDPAASSSAGPLVEWLLDGRTLSTGPAALADSADGSGDQHDHDPDTGARSRGGGINVLTELSPAGIVSTLQVASVTASDAGAYECRVRDVGADAVHVLVVQKGDRPDGGGIIVQPWSLDPDSQQQQQQHNANNAASSTLPLRFVPLTWSGLLLMRCWHWHRRRLD